MHEKAHKSELIWKPNNKKTTDLFPMVPTTRTFAYEHCKKKLRLTQLLFVVHVLESEIITFQGIFLLDNGCPTFFDRLNWTEKILFPFAVVFLLDCACWLIFIAFGVWLITFPAAKFFWKRQSCCTWTRWFCHTMDTVHNSITFRSAHKSQTQFLEFSQFRLFAGTSLIYFIILRLIDDKMNK